MKRVATLSVQVIVEAEEDNLSRSVNYVAGAIKASCRGIRNAEVAIGVFDEDDKLLGVDITGNPSEEMKEAMQQFFYEEPV